ncbi:MAG TPA: hypothetical protein VJU58_13740 [Microbacterium sp.]|nr:hypothetical protein [Microbacterium sp.]
MTVTTGPSVVLELPFQSDREARRALLRGVCRRAAKLLRDELNYPGAALALEAHAETLRAPHQVEDDGETTVVEVWP